MKAFRSQISSNFANLLEKNLVKIYNMNGLLKVKLL